MEDLERTPRPRRAAPEDMTELVRLRALMLGAMGEPEERLNAAWRDAAAGWFERHLALTDGFAAFVVDGVDGGLVAAAAGVCVSRAPNGSDLTGLTGRVFNVVTEPSFRRRGLARQCAEAILRWFTEQGAVGTLELSATGDGDALYRSLGFREADHPTFRLRLSR